MALATLLIAVILAVAIALAVLMRRLLAGHAKHTPRRLTAMPQTWLSRTRPGSGSAGRRSARRAEAHLTAQLLAGALCTEDYRNAMATLASRDAIRHPVDVPPDR